MRVHPVRTLTLWFCSWKILLLLVMLASPGPGYDTSTTFLSPISSVHALSVPLKLVRWDSIYFLKIASRGYLYEQEWAFGYGYTKLLSILTAGSSRGLLRLTLVGIGLSHICHYLSVLLLYSLTRTVFQKARCSSTLSLLSAALHIICPAGPFLSAPYGEALFSFLNFLGFYIYALALRDDRQGSVFARDVRFVTAGCVFAVATTVRSNGILSGMLFAYDAFGGLVEILRSRSIVIPALRRLIFVALGGTVVLFGIACPQYLAYSLYCQSSISPRSWCSKMIPNIYTWVQGRYWNVGFLKYWTPLNMPLFLLAAPMLLFLLCSSSWALAARRHSPTEAREDDQVDVDPENGHTQACLSRLALPQATLAVLALTSYHVQIITRIASGYPLWYWWLASHFLSDGKPGLRGSPLLKPGYVLRGMVLYGIIQTALFASFLPPA